MPVAVYTGLAPALAQLWQVLGSRDKSRQREAFPSRGRVRRKGDGGGSGQEDMEMEAGLATITSPTSRLRRPNTDLLESTPIQSGCPSGLPGNYIIYFIDYLYKYFCTFFNEYIK